MCMWFFAHKNLIFDKITAVLTLTFQTLVSSIDWMCWGSWVRMGQGVRTGLGHGGITCVLQTQFSSLLIKDKAFSEWWKMKRRRRASSSSFYIPLFGEARPHITVDSASDLRAKFMALIHGPATYFGFSFHFFKKGSCHLLAKVCVQSTG